MKTAVPIVTVVRKFTDGSAKLAACGVEISVNRRGGVVGLSDWGATDALVAAGVLTRNVWRGSGLYGHDTYNLAGPMPA